MSGYIGPAPVPQATQTRETFTATASQTSFATAGYNVGYLDVYLNGVHLVDGDDYTASNGSDVVLSSGATAGDILEVVAYKPFEVVDQNFTGDFSVDTDTLYVDSVNKRLGIETNSPSTTLDVQGDVGVSGGIYLGGTGSANYLDDYEEGTWTPFVDGSSSSPSVGYTSRTGFYTKIGRIVQATCAVKLDGISGGSGKLLMKGLPFLPAVSDGLFPLYLSPGEVKGNPTGNFNIVEINPDSVDGAQFRPEPDELPMLVSDADGDTAFRFTVSYQTDS